MKSEKQFYTSVIFLMSVLLFSNLGQLHAATVLKVSMVTPEGSTWTNSLYKMAREVNKLSDGEIKFKIFAGGVSGDELDVIRKMKANRIHAAGFSGVGLGVILPKIRILEAPLLYKSEKEVDVVKSKLRDELASDFESRGFVLLGFAEAGFVYFFSKVTMAGPQGFKPLKMWVWKGDPVAKASLAAFNINAFPLSLADVTTGLETNMINSFYSPPLASVAFQWYPKIKYILDYPIVNSTGAFLIKKRTFERLSVKNQNIIKSVSQKFCDEVVHLARIENNEALVVLRESGIIFELPTKEQIKSFEETSIKVNEMNIGKLYDRDTYLMVEKILEDFRNN